ncbi:fimbrial biogenesis chaperone [Providencia sp. PROV134]|uniref:fimbrial biogenesis chaperone n=1 Tax=Providencia sp. PROV134 TaxID=2949844 RepID=UPI00234B15ED|nr:molecular chaperone [Providencia sp. PROV134]
MKSIYLSIFLLITSNSYAGVLANQSRIIFDSTNNVQTLLIANTNNYPIVVQTWVDNGNGNPLSVVPVVVTPSTFRLEPKQVQALKIFNINELKGSSELVYWLNLYEIPPKDTKIANSNITRVDLTMNTQHKIFIRPSQLGSFPAQIEQYLTFTVIDKNNQSLLRVTNTSNFHVSFTQLCLSNKNDKNCAIPEMDMMLKPSSSKEYQLEETTTPSYNILIYQYINDGGSVVEKTADLH